MLAMGTCFLYYAYHQLDMTSIPFATVSQLLMFLPDLLTIHRTTFKASFYPSISFLHFHLIPTMLPSSISFGHVEVFWQARTVSINSALVWTVPTSDTNMWLPTVIFGVCHGNVSEIHVCSEGVLSFMVSCRTDLVASNRASQDIVRQHYQCCHHPRQHSRSPVSPSHRASQDTVL
jgi:hypothetical protein